MTFSFLGLECDRLEIKECAGAKGKSIGGCVMLGIRQGTLAVNLWDGTSRGKKKSSHYDDSRTESNQANNKKDAKSNSPVC